MCSFISDSSIFVPLTNVSVLVPKPCSFYHNCSVVKLRLHLAPIRIPKIKPQEAIHIEKDVEKMNTPILLVGLQTGKTNLEINLELPQKVGNRSS